MDRLESTPRRFELILHKNGHVERVDLANPANNVTLAPPVPVEPDPEPEPGPLPVVSWPSIGASYYTSLTDPDLDLPVFAAWLRDVGVQHTRVWLLDAWALGEREADGSFKRGQYDGRMPVQRLADGRFDLWAWNDAYFTHLRTYAETLNACGIWPHFTLLELYTWSALKAPLPFVPDANRNLFRHNVNGIRWGDPDDPTFFTLPDAWLTEFIWRVVETLDGTAWAPETGNEMPEKPLHFRLADVLWDAGWRGDISTNRQSGSPGQYWNMGIGGGPLSHIAWHDKRTLAYLDEVFPDEAAAGRPTTFREAWPMFDAPRVIISSDGAGGNPAAQPGLLEVAQDALARGASYEHQLALKRNRFFGDGSLRMSDLVLDETFLRTLTGA